jgi:hypothetical protein
MSKKYVAVFFFGAWHFFSGHGTMDTIADFELRHFVDAADGRERDWQKIDLVRGLTRSQHDHMLNGVEYITDENGEPALLVSVGGHAMLARRRSRSIIYLNTCSPVLS